MKPIGVTSSDLDKLRRLLDPERPAGVDDDIAPSFLEDLSTLVPCDPPVFQVMDVVRQTARGQSPDGLEEEPDDLDLLFWEGFWACLACSYPQHSGDHRTVARLSDFYSRKEFGGTTMGSYMAQVGVRHEVMVPLPMLDTLDRRLLLFRNDGPDFSERDVLLLSLLRPQVVEMHLRQLRRRRGAPELTKRQWEILRLLAAGCSNRQIARALSISETTVGKHLENLYGRLGVNSRTEALAKVPPLEQDMHCLVS